MSKSLQTPPSGFRPPQTAGGIMGIIGFARGDDRSGYLVLAAETKAMLGLAAGILHGVVLGLPIGASVGSKDVYLLEAKKHEPE